MTTIAIPTIGRRNGLEGRWRLLVATGGGALSLLIGWALLRYALGIAPAMSHLGRPALMIHIASVVPAIPLGAYLLLARKGDVRHRLLGRLWMLLMLATAISAIFIRNINQGHFSWIHLFVILTLVSVPRAILAAKRGDIEGHRNVVLGLYLGAALVAGFAAFLPHRTMWWMAFG